MKALFHAAAGIAIMTMAGAAYAAGSDASPTAGPGGANTSPGTTQMDRNDGGATPGIDRGATQDRNPSLDRNDRMGGSDRMGTDSDRPSTGTGTGTGTGTTGLSQDAPATPPANVVGMDVVNPQGEKIGEVSRVAGNQVIVGVGGFLGIGERDVALSWSSLQMIGSGDRAKLQTTLSEEALEKLPKYTGPAGSTGAPTGGAAR